MARGPPGKITDSWNQGHKVAREMAAVLGHRVGVEGFLGVERVARGTAGVRPAEYTMMGEREEGRGLLRGRIPV